MMPSIPGSLFDEFLSYCDNQSFDKAKLMLQNDEGLIERSDESGNTPLHHAVKNDYPMDFMHLLCNRDIINKPNIDGETPLILAAMYNQMQITEYLINQGADVNFVDKDGHSALQWSVVNRALDILDLLLTNKASVSLEDSSGCQALHYAVTDFDQPASIIKQLMEHGADADCVDSEGRTPLHWASSCGNVEAFRCLLQYRADVECLDDCQLTVLHCAVSRNQLELADLILSQTTFQRNPDPKDSNGCTPLFYSVSFGFHQMSELLLNRKSMVNAQDHKLRSCAHYAAARGQLESLKLLRKFRASFDLANHRGDLPIHEAAQCGQYECVEYLLNLNKNHSNAKNNVGRTPLHLAAASKDDDVRLCKLLVENNGSINALVTGKNGKLYTPLDIAEAKMNRRIIAYLRSISAEQARGLDEKEIVGLERSAPASNDKGDVKNRTVDTMVQTVIQNRKLKHKCKKFRRRIYKMVYIVRNQTQEAAELLKPGDSDPTMDEVGHGKSAPIEHVKDPVSNPQASEQKIDPAPSTIVQNGRGSQLDMPHTSKALLPSNTLPSSRPNGRRGTMSQISSHWSSVNTATGRSRRGARLCEIYARAAAAAQSPKLAPLVECRHENFLKEEKRILQQLATLKRVELMYGRMQEKYLVKKMVDDWRRMKRHGPEAEEHMKIRTFESWEKFLYGKLEELRQRQIGH